MTQIDLDQRLKIVNDGKLAELAWSFFHDALDKEKETVLKKLLQSYHAQAYDLASISALIGAYASLEALELKLKKKVLGGRKENGELLKDGDQV